jgi:YNFM family putative membrane transporter
MTLKTRKRKAWTALVQTQGWPVVLLLVVQLLSGIVLTPQRSFFPIYVEEQLGRTAVVVSAFVTMGQLLGMVASAVGGMLCDVLGRKRTLVLGLTGFVFGSLMYLVRVPWLVASLWAISCLGLGFHALGGQSYMIDVAGPEHLGLISALFHWGYTIGGALSSPGAGLILDRQGFGPFGLALLALSLATTLGTLAFLPRLRATRGAGTPVWSRSLFGYRDVIRRPVMVILGLLRFLPTCYYGMATVLNPLLINRMAGNKTAVSLYTTLSLILATLGQAVAGRAADRWGRRRPTLVVLGVLIIAIVGQASFATHLWSFYTFGVLGICAAWSLATLLPCLVSDAAATEERGRVLGMLEVLWNVGMMAGALIGGTLVETALGLPFFVAAMLNLGTIALAVSFFRLVAPRENRVA